MPKYKYQIINKQGERKDGIIKGKSKQAVVQRLKSQDYYILQLSQKLNKRRVIDLVNKFNRITYSQLALFSRQFSTLLAAGLSLLKVLTILEQQVADKQLKQAVQEIRKKVKTGEELSAAFREQSHVFPKLMINLIAVGEEGGILPQILEQLTDYFREKADLKQELRSIIVYPLFLLVTALIVVLVLIICVLPTFADIFANYGLQLPLITRGLLRGASFIRANWQLLFGGLLIGGGGVGFWAATDSARRWADWLSLRLPLIGDLTVKVFLLQLTRTLGTMLQAGINLLPALKRAKRLVGNYIIARQIGEFHSRVEQGQQLSRMMGEKDLIPNLVVQMVKVGEETGELGEMLLKAADYYQQEIKSEVGFLFSLLEPIIVLLLAGVVVAILISVLLPMFNMINFI